jgi:hypothetical protein
MTVRLYTIFYPIFASILHVFLLALIHVSAAVPNLVLSDDSFSIAMWSGPC